MASVHLESKRPRTIRQYVLEAVRAEILVGRMPGGKRLRQEEIANWLGVSTTPVREAMRDLVTEGLIDFDPHRGAVVRRLAMEDARDIYHLRMVLEPMLIERAHKLPGHARLEVARAVHERMCAISDIHEWTRLDQEFQSGLWGLEASGRLAHILAGLRAAAMPYVAMAALCNHTLIEHGNDVHGQILRHLCNGQFSSAVKTNHSNLETMLSFIERSMCGEAQRP